MLGSPAKLKKTPHWPRTVNIWKKLSTTKWQKLLLTLRASKLLRFISIFVILSMTCLSLSVIYQKALWYQPEFVLKHLHALKTDIYSAAGYDNCTLAHGFNSQCRIPRILHQSWKTDVVPTASTAEKRHSLSYGDYIQSWPRMNPDWVYLFWTDASNAMLFKYTPELAAFRSAFLNKKLPGIARADFSRYAYMYVFGGVYADIDFECLRPFDELPTMTGFVSSEPKDQTMAIYGKPLVVCNAIMASAPGHPFWLKVMEAISGKIQAGDPNCFHDVNYCTGPQMLQGIYEDWASNKSNVEIPLMPSEYFYPELAENPNVKLGCAKLKEEKQYECHLDEPFDVDSFAVHHWGNSWGVVHEFHDYANIAELIPANQLWKPFEL